MKADQPLTAEQLATETANVLKELEKQVATDYAPPRVKRDAHPKMHGCVQASLTVCQDIASDLQHGVFSTPGKSYRTWLRFSNAFKIQHDIEFETRGMALKLLEVRGDKLSDDEEGTQDFLFATWPAFFLSNGTDYHLFAQATETGGLAVLKFFVSRGMWRAFYQLQRSALVMARSPLAISYFSQTPYRLGPDTVVKLQIRPSLTRELTDSLPAAWVFACQALRGNLKLMTSKSSAVAEAWCEDRIAPRNFLRLAMMDFLAKHDATFDLLVQRQAYPARMPIDDATRIWPEDLSPFERVAIIRIPRQVFWPQAGQSKELADAANEMMALGENMSFRPWHALEAHQPLGPINEMRKVIYPAIVKLRRSLNGVTMQEPTADQFDRLGKIVRR